MGMCVHLSPEGPTGNSPLGEAAVNLLILQMFTSFLHNVPPFVVYFAVVVVVVFLKILLLNSQVLGKRLFLL